MRIMSRILLLVHSDARIERASECNLTRHASSALPGAGTVAAIGHGHCFMIEIKIRLD